MRPGAVTFTGDPAGISGHSWRGYRLLERIGKGGSGEVWKAEAAGGFFVALKFVPLADRLGDRELRSLEILRTVRHPNLLVTLGAWIEDDQLVIAMELADRTLWGRFQEATEAGLPGIPRPFAGLGVGGAEIAYLALVIAVDIAAVLLIRHMVRSPFGRLIQAIRDDETAVMALGKDPAGAKIKVFMIGAAIAGIAGALYAHYFRFVTSEQFEILMSATILTMVVVGGLRTPWGPVVGAILLQILPQAITFLNLPPVLLGPLQGLLFTGLVLIFMFLRPGGLVQAGNTWQARGSRRGSG